MLLLVALPGCLKSEPAQFRLNVVKMRQAGMVLDQDTPPEKVAERTQIVQEQQRDIATALEALFGTPDQPFVLAQETGLDLKKIEMSAGPVWSDQAGAQHGLFRQHCAHCHGVTGDGLGPTAAILNPYPRDYRPGMYKFKSTERPEMPTHEDLLRILRDGVPGTAMPSFALLPSAEVESLGEYVKYLTLRGQVELALIYKTQDLGEGEKLTLDRANLVDEVLLTEVAKWTSAQEKVVRPVDKPEMELAESIARGRGFFYGKADCKKCHGDSALGDGQTNDWDDWNKPIEAADVALGALPKRNAIPRNLRMGIYRGGRRPLDLYRRIHAGINGVPMPSVVDLLSEDEKTQLSADEQKRLQGERVWNLVDYVRSLPYEAMNRPVRATTIVGQGNL